MAIPALEAVVRLETCPLVFCQFEAHVEKLPPRTDRAEDVAPNLLRGLDLAGNLVGPIVGDVAIWTSRTNA